MTARLVVASLLVAATASADPHHVLVLKSEGAADAATRAKVDAAVLKLAKHVDGKVTAGDITMGDAAAAVGCQPDSPTCKDEVLATLAVDEVVATTVTPERNGNLKIVVRRISKTGTQDATTTIAATQTDKLEPVGPLFGLPGPASAPAPAAPPPAAAKTAPAPPPTPTPAPAITTTAPNPEAPPETAPAPAPAPAALPPPTTTPVEVDDHPSRRRYEIAGMIGGGACVVLGVVMWAAAASTQSDIDNAPTKTAKDIQALKDLESKGDGQAALGNFLFVGGVVLAGVSTYFYIKDRRSGSAHQARITPTVFDHGAGLAFTIGGIP